MSQKNRGNGVMVVTTASVSMGAGTSLVTNRNGLKGLLISGAALLMLGSSLEANNNIIDGIGIFDSAKIRIADRASAPA